ncbi:MAG: hypothetical protein MHMPM18_003452 [Marteilia pararefringens]
MIRHLILPAFEVINSLVIFLDISSRIKLAFGGQYKIIYFYDLLLNCIENTSNNHGNSITTIAIKKNSPTHLLSSSHDRSIHVWSLVENKLISIISDSRAHTDSISALDISNCNKYIFSGGFDCHLVVWFVGNLMGKTFVERKVKNEIFFKNFLIINETIDQIKIISNYLIIKFSDQSIVLSSFETISDHNFSVKPIRVINYTSGVMWFIKSDIQIINKYIVISVPLTDHKVKLLFMCLQEEDEDEIITFDADEVVHSLCFLDKNLFYAYGSSGSVRIFACKLSVNEY